MNIIVSACLLGCKTRYSGDGKQNEEILKLKEKHNLIPVCPEQLGGLATPRQPSEQREDRVITCDGSDVTEAFEQGAQEVLRLAKIFDCDTAILKERSPSCGSGRVYDGTFSGTQIDGDGVTARLLKQNGIRVIGESSLERL